jgi:hypothetical protein
MEEDKMVSRIQRNRSRLPDPLRFKSNLNITILANYVDDLVKTLRLRMESIESEMDYQDDRTRVLEVDTDTELGTDTPVVLCDGNINVELPNAVDAFDDQSIITIKARTAAVTVIPQGGEQIENATNYVIPALSSIIIVSDGDNWWITASYP